MENNLDAILKSFRSNPEKYEEELRKGIIKIAEKGYIFKEEAPQVKNNKSANEDLNANNAYSFNAKNNQNTNQNTNQNANQNNFNLNREKPNANMKRNHKIQSSSDSNDFTLLNNLDDILLQYSEEPKEAHHKKASAGPNSNYNNLQTSNFNQLNSPNNPVNSIHYNREEPKQINNLNQGANITVRNKSKKVEVVNLESHSNTTNSFTDNKLTSNLPKGNTYDDDFYLDDEDVAHLFLDDSHIMNSLNMNVIEPDRKKPNYVEPPKQNNNYNNVQSNFSNNNYNNVQSNYSSSNPMQSRNVQNNNNNVQSNYSNNNNFQSNNNNNNFQSNNNNYNSNNNVQPNKSNSSNLNNNVQPNKSNSSNLNNNVQPNKSNSSNLNNNVQPNKSSNIQNNPRKMDDEDPDEPQFIEKYCVNHKVADLKEWGKKFEWDEIVENANLRVFGYRTFRPNQREIINASLCGRDIFVCMPTGGGKSLTFQIPALISDGVTLVVMPLISLIQDQVSQMNGLGVKVLFLNKEGEEELRTQFHSFFKDEDSDERCKLIFVTPEKIAQSRRTMETLKELDHQGLLDRFVIDEAHCVSQWGREFRKDYLNLKILRLEFPRVPLLAITATAPNKVREDIINVLGMRDCLFFRSSYNRNNLYIEIRNKKDMSDIVQNMANFIQKKYPDACGLIYCASKKECEQLSQKLRKDHGLSASYYHAAMPDKQKTLVQEKWKNDEIKIIVATVAFGMGINKADVRFVIHQAMPKSFENYYQEIGRAGRDGKKSHCVLYYNPGDRRTLEFLLFKSTMTAGMITQNLRKINEIIDYCEEFCECRRVIALLYFDEVFNRRECNNMCDNCRKNLVKEEKDVTDECVKILSFMKNCQASNLDYTPNQAIDYLRGVKSKANKRAPNYDNNFGVLKGQSNDNLKKVFRRLIVSKYIDEKLVSTGNDKVYAAINISNEGGEFLRNRNGKSVVITFPRVSGKGYEVEQGFIERANDKDLDVYNYSSKDDVELVSQVTKTNNAVKKDDKKERKYNRVKEVENKDKRQSVNVEEDYGFCTAEEFDELLDKLKITRRQILREENKKIESENLQQIIEEQQIKKLAGDDIFPVTGLKELCRKLPTSERELNSNYIFGVGAKFLQKYGKMFLPEIVKHVNLYRIDKSDNKYQDEISNPAITISSAKKLKSVEKTNLKPIGAIKNINTSNFKLVNSTIVRPQYNSQSSNREAAYSSNIFKSNNNVAMFNSMGEKKSENVNVGKVVDEYDDEMIESFLKDFIPESQGEKKEDDLDNFFDEIENYESLEKREKQSQLNKQLQKQQSNNINNNNTNNIHPSGNVVNHFNVVDHEDFNDFEAANIMNNLGEFMGENDQEEDSGEEFNEIADQVRAMNDKMANKKKRKRNEEDGEDNEEQEQGGKRGKPGKKKSSNNNQANYFKKRAAYNKINTNRAKKNNFI